MGLFDFFGWAFSEARLSINWLYREVVILAIGEQYLYFRQVTTENFFVRAIKAIGKGVVDTLKDLKNHNWVGIWERLKGLWDRYQKALKWYDKHVLDPIDQVRRQLDHLYSAIFGPIVRTIDSFRAVTRIIGVFNRRLAAQIDARIFALEGAILSPLIGAYRRINGLTSFVRAVVTKLGYFDRSILIGSIRRDAGLILGTLTNPRRVALGGVTNRGPFSYGSAKSDLDQYFQNGTGPVANRMTEVRASADRAFTQFGIPL